MWGLVDCDNFFCSCERVFRPDLNGRPVVVLSNNDGCVIARSREAKALGVKMGLPYYQMLQQFPPSVITAFSSNYRLYGDMSARVMATLREEVPVLHQYSIDEAFIDFHGFEAADLKVYGEKLAAKVLKWTGLPVTIGIAPTKTLAKVAARFGKNYAGYKKCCMIADDAQREKALRLFDVEDVWGIGRRIAKKLRYKGINTAYDFTQQPRNRIKSEFHVPGERTWLELLGYDVIGIDEMDSKTKQNIVTSRSFPDMLKTIEDLRPHIANYAARCAMKLRRQKTVCAMVTVFLQSNYFREDLPQYSGSASFIFSTPTSSTSEIVKAAEDVMKKIFRYGISYKRGGVMVSEISSGKAIQPDLFEFDANRSMKYRVISATLDDINNNLGADTVILAAQQYTKKDDSGKSVKFSHAIKRALLSPDYSTSFNAFIVK